MTKSQVVTALIGYKYGTYGGNMKGLMKGQVAKYSDDELKRTGIGR
jgi:cytochrome c-type protein NapB